MYFISTFLLLCILKRKESTVNRRKKIFVEGFKIIFLSLLLARLRFRLNSFETEEVNRKNTYTQLYTEQFL